MNLIRLEQIVRTILHFSPFNIYGYTDHSERHAERVVEQLEQLWNMVNNFFSGSPIVTQYGFLSQQNKERLVASAWLHDIGNLFGRVVHHYHTYEMLMRTELRSGWQTPFLWTGVGMTTTDREWIARVCKAHRKPTDRAPALSDYFVDIRDPNSDYGQDPLLQFDSALLLIADALDISADRAPSEVYNLLPFFWKRYPETHAFGMEHWEEYRKTRSPTFSVHVPHITIWVDDVNQVQGIIDNLSGEFSYVNDIFRTKNVHFQVEARDNLGGQQTIW